MARNSPILCRICGKKMGVVPDFEGRIFTLCIPCEKGRKTQKKSRKSTPPQKKAQSNL